MDGSTPSWGAVLFRVQSTTECIASNVGEGEDSTSSGLTHISLLLTKLGNTSFWGGSSEKEQRSKDRMSLVQFQPTPQFSTGSSSVERQIGPIKAFLEVDGSIPSPWTCVLGTQVPPRKHVSATNGRKRAESANAPVAQCQSILGKPRKVGRSTRSRCASFRWSFNGRTRAWSPKGSACMDVQFVPTGPYFNKGDSL